MSKTKNSNVISRVSVDSKDLTRANKYLAATGYRICRYTGQLLTLNTKNFYRNSNDSTGFEQMSKEGKKLYNNGWLYANDNTANVYDKNIGATTELL